MPAKPAEMDQDTASEPIPSLKDLASSEPSLRRTSLNNAISHINERSPSSPLTPTQCLQLWRGLYIALYMHDSKNAISVQNLTAELAGTVQMMAAKDEELGLSSSRWLDTWTAAFWETICREWASIDQWRMNKVLLLVRLALRDTFNVLLNSTFTHDLEEKSQLKARFTSQIQVLTAWPVSSRERKVPDGLRLHVLDIWTDELVGQISAVQQHSQSEGNTPVDPQTILVEAGKKLMVPVERVSKEALNKAVKLRAKDSLSAFSEKFLS